MSLKIIVVSYQTINVQLLPKSEQGSVWYITPSAKEGAASLAMKLLTFDTKLHPQNEAMK